MNNEQIIEKLKSLGFIISKEYSEKNFIDWLREDEADCYLLDLDLTHQLIYETNCITEWQSNGCIIFIDEELEKYVNLEDFETYLKITKTN